MVLIDTHCHLQMKTFKDDMDRIVDDAIVTGIEAIINVGFDVKSSEKAVELSRKYACMFAAVGIHPHDAKMYNSNTLADLNDFLNEEKVIAIGEIGLDFYRNLSPPEVQERVFSEQLFLAKEKDIQVILHVRDAYTRVFEIIEKEKPKKVLLHCFSGSVDDAKRGIAMGFYISFAGNITYSQGRLTDAAREVPFTSMLIETDAPFLSPIPYRGKRNEPSFLRYTVEKLAEIKDVSVEDVAHITTNNAQKFFWEAIHG